MKNILILTTLVSFALLSFTGAVPAKYFTKTGTISFYSHTNVEDIEAINHKVTSVFETKGGKMQFSVLMKAFEFEKALMQEHFNENYVESDKYPKASFDGKIDQIQNIQFEKDGTYKSKVSGNLTIKNKTNAVSTDGTFIVKDGNVQGKATFKIRLADYNVTIPSVVKDKINEYVEIKVDMNYKPM